jgi:hypothetical protein
VIFNKKHLVGLLEGYSKDPVEAEFVKLVDCLGVLQCDRLEVFEDVRKDD